MKLFIDDIRYPESSDMVIARTSKEAISIIEKQIPEFISFDHDLGGEDTTIPVVNKLIELILDGTKLPDNFDYFIHSMNPIGASNIKNKMDCILSWYFKNYKESK